ncbi:hypothetical protein A2866_05520 [Candidatus Roizmanbacteria bacterium RIFCSPHIGHO2_01_FULL_39_8]|uniref:NAD-dependent epimerase/dehydratase domain-containing protein n=2 Tax=Candidatus Roizmaniibacteriota TaxID=1752723 RepID=A0A1F7GGZ0_9BACT|nr:MAG: hypothetical protein A2866_05520 [Candidatus Roizmanbacteria bacterium RIFCSPHIGHO2_01_FULL_39_8]OGK26588.1 MAG: hypothetical protein A3C28_03730 [Candidatus Roizmanbacteria bacterium RIFCSPHIGHO2_02_FULL_39_9]
MNILVTGGAGFIGSFLTDSLIKKGHKVRIYDNLEYQVHQGKIPEYLNKKAEFIRADITNASLLDKALQDIDIVFHEAAMVGVGQSMYQIGKYTRINTYGTGLLLDLIINKHKKHIKKLIIAASMSEYGEGLYRCDNCGDIKPDLRSEQQLQKKTWELVCPNCRSVLRPKATSEKTPLITSSIYALNKRDQEEMVMMIGKAFKIPSVALRYFNVYGPRQSLANPYTGVAAIFISRIKANKPPVINEDGNQSRDFVSVHDIVSANIAVMKNPKADYQIFNVGSGDKITILKLSQLLIKLQSGNNSGLLPLIRNEFRKGDIRHCFADITKINRTIGWQPKMNFEKGLDELIRWSKTAYSEDLFDKAQSILQKKGVI